MSHKLLYPISLVLVLALAGFAQAELLVNPDFEDGIKLWKSWGSGSGSGGYVWSMDYRATIIDDGTAKTAISMLRSASGSRRKIPNGGAGATPLSSRNMS